MKNNKTLKVFISPNRVIFFICILQTSSSLLKRYPLEKILIGKL